MYRQTPLTFRWTVPLNSIFLHLSSFFLFLSHLYSFFYLRPKSRWLTQLPTMGVRKEGHIFLYIHPGQWKYWQNCSVLDMLKFWPTFRRMALIKLHYGTFQISYKCIQVYFYLHSVIYSFFYVALMTNIVLYSRTIISWSLQALYNMYPVKTYSDLMLWHQRYSP